MRRTLSLLFVLTATVASMAIIFGGGAASADPGNGATVVRNPYGTGAYCNVTDVNHGAFQYYFPCTIQVVNTPAGGVNEWIRGTVDPNYSSALPDRALQVPTSVTGELCDPTSGALYTTAGVVTPSGQVNLTCRVVAK